MATVFQYDLTPADIDYSASGTELSIVTLTLNVTNPDSAAVDCSSISLNIPVGIGTSALTLDASTISVAPGPNTPWAIAPMGGTIFTAVPLPPVTGLAGNQSISFVFSNVIVNQAGGTVSITVTEETTSQQTATVTVDKNAVITTTQTTPTIVSFTATPPQVALNGTTTLSWTVDNATSCVLDPGAVQLASASSGNLPLTVGETTIYTLVALSPGGSAEALVTVPVMAAAIGSFTATPTTVTAGSPATLQWTTSFATTCSIDQGVGPVASSSSITVTPQQTTVYTLTATGLDPQTSTAMVTVSPS